MDDFLQKKQTCTPHQATALRESILDMLVTDIYVIYAISMVDGEGFKKTICQFNPEYNLPSRTHFTHLMEKIYETTFLKVNHKYTYTHIIAITYFM